MKFGHFASIIRRASVGSLIISGLISLLQTLTEVQLNPSDSFIYVTLLEKIFKGNYSKKHKYF